MIGHEKAATWSSGNCDDQDTQLPSVEVCGTFLRVKEYKAGFRTSS